LRRSAPALRARIPALCWFVPEVHGPGPHEPIRPAEAVVTSEASGVPPNGGGPRYRRRAAVPRRGAAARPGKLQPEAM